MRLSDILKKTSQIPLSRQNPTPEQSPSPDTVHNAQPVPAPIPAAREERISTTAEEVYAKAIIEIKNIISGIDKGVPYSSSIVSVPAIARLIEEGNEDILLLADKATPDIYLYGHCVNLCIFATCLGKGFGYNTEKLLNLGYCAFLIDIGLSPSPGAKKERGQSNADNHDLLKMIPELTENIKTLILEVIIQNQNQKTPAGISELKGTDIHDFARIIAVANVFETLTHPRAGKERMIPHEALKSMINTSNQGFDNEIIKMFLERLSLYPPGSYVKLNSEEIGRVVGLNKGLPTRPKVKVMIDSSGQRLAARLVDLSTNPMIFIKEALDETKLNLADKKLMLELKAVRWWVKGL